DAAFVRAAIPLDRCRQPFPVPRIIDRVLDRWHLRRPVGPVPEPVLGLELSGVLFMVETHFTDITFFGPLKPVNITAIRSLLCVCASVPGLVVVKLEPRSVPIGHAAALRKRRDVKISA